MGELEAINACVGVFARRGVPIERDELVGVAQVAYARALTTYRPAAGASVSSWTWQAMWHGMLDECIRLDPHTRGQRRKIRAGLVPTTHGGREVPLVTVGELREDLYGSLDVAASVSARLDLLAALRSLPMRQRSIMLWRGMGYTQREIGATIGVTEARVCQIERDVRRRIARFA